MLKSKPHWRSTAEANLYIRVGEHTYRSSPIIHNVALENGGAIKQIKLPFLFCTTTDVLSHYFMILLFLCLYTNTNNK